MQVTGYLIREALRRYELRRDTAANQFQDSLMAFPDEQKPTPDEVTKDYVTAEVAIAKLQAAQARYNLRVNVDVLGETMSLCEAIKRIGGAGRIEKMWMVYAGGGKKDRYGYRDPSVRTSTEVHATRVLPVKEAMNRSNKLAALASALRAAIATGNSAKVDSDQLGLDPTLLTE